MLVLYLDKVISVIFIKIYRILVNVDSWYFANELANKPLGEHCRIKIKGKDLK